MAEEGEQKRVESSGLTVAEGEGQMLEQKRIEWSGFAGPERGVGQMLMAVAESGQTLMAMAVRVGQMVVQKQST